MPIIIAAAIPTVATFIARMGVTKAAKKYAPKLIKEATAYIKKNKLIFDGKKLIKPPKGSITTATKKTTKKMNVVKKSKNPRSPKKKKKDSFDEELKKKEGTKNFNKNNKDATTTNKAPKAYVDKFGNPHRTAAGADRANKLNKNPRSPKNKKLKKEEKPINQNIQTKAQLEKSLKNKKMITGGAILAGSIGLPFLKGKGDKVIKGYNSAKDSITGGPSTFGAAFKKARKEKGPNSTFTFKGKQYSTVTMDQVKKAGFNSLNEYLNAQRKKSKTTKPGT